MIIFVDARSRPPARPKPSRKKKNRKKKKCGGKMVEDECKVEDNMPDHDYQNELNINNPTSPSCFPFAVNCRLSKTFFGIPRKCSLCHKIIILNAGYACQFCRYRCHKKCLTEGRSPSACSLSRLPSGDDQLFNKLLLENEINSNDVNVYDNWASLLSDVSSLNALPRVRVNSDSCIGSMGEESAPHSSFSSPRLVMDRCSSTSSDTLTSSLPRSPNINEAKQNQSGVMDKFLQLLWWRSPLDDDKKLSRPDSLIGGSSRSSAASPVRTPVDDFNYTLLEELFQQRSSASSTASNPVVCLPTPTTGTSNLLSRRLNWLKHFIGERPTHSQDCVTDTYTSAIPIQRMQRVQEDAEPSPIRLSSSWPIMGLHMNHEDTILEETHEDCETHVLDICKPDRRSTDVTEWSIPFEDIEFGESVSQGRLFHTFSGRWHGEATIHKYTSNDTEGFLKEVQSLARIRHENITLFMGACIQSPLLAVIMSCQKGVSLHETIHENKRKLSHQAKVNIARQIAQGMGYLHAKNVVMKCLSSKTIFLENKVKLCMVDYGGPSLHYACKSALVHKHHLTYCSPELITNMIITPPSIQFNVHHTKASDLYAFGTVLYELLSGTYPLLNLCIENVIYAVGHGTSEHVDHLTCHSALRKLVKDLWLTNPAQRPSFTTILLQLQQTAALNKKHSSSEPRLNQAGNNHSFLF